MSFRLFLNIPWLRQDILPLDMRHQGPLLVWGCFDAPWVLDIGAVPTLTARIIENSLVRKDAGSEVSMATGGQMFL